MYLDKIYLVLGAEQGRDNDQPEDSEVSPAVNVAHLVDMSEPFLQDQVGASKLGVICHPTILACPYKVTHRPASVCNHSCLFSEL